MSGIIANFAAMKRQVVVIAILLALCSTATAQEQPEEVEEQKPKTGWVFTPLPNLGYSTDTGVTLGVFSDFFYYGDGSSYPNFLHHVGFAGAYTTKGSWYFHAYGDSPTLIPGVRLNGTLTYRHAMVHNFYGFNGIASPYLPELDANPATRTAWYTLQRRFFRATGTAMGNISGQLDWMGGLVARHVMMDDFSLERYNSGNSLLLTYRDIGLIRADEFKGGTSLEFKGGLVFDSRDVEASPGKGFFAELYLTANADLSRWKYNYGQLVAHFRHYVTIFPGRWVFAYHLGLQHQLWGELPYYALNEIANSFYPYEEMDGLGSRTTVRGIRNNRVAAAGYAWANIEFRVTPFKFDLFKQHFDLVLNPFMDVCGITRSYRLEEQKSLAAAHPDIPLYQDKKLPVMVAFGIGGKIQMNTNFVMSFDVGRGLDPQVGTWTVSTASTYLF